MSDRCHTHGTRCCQTCEPPIVVPDLLAKLKESLRQDAESEAKRPDHEKRFMPAIAADHRGTCPRCREHKFIGHGPLCTDCASTPADTGSTPDDRDEPLLDHLNYKRIGPSWREAKADFLAALAEHDRQTEAKALRDAAAQLHTAPILRRQELALARWLRDRADRIGGDR